MSLSLSLSLILRVPESDVQLRYFANYQECFRTSFRESPPTSQPASQPAYLSTYTCVYIYIHVYIYIYIYICTRVLLGATAFVCWPSPAPMSCDIHTDSYPHPCQNKFHKLPAVLSCSANSFCELSWARAWV